jgi:hypothetical protein
MRTAIEAPLIPLGRDAECGRPAADLSNNLLKTTKRRDGTLARLSGFPNYRNAQFRKMLRRRARERSSYGGSEPAHPPIKVKIDLEKVQKAKNSTRISQFSISLSGPRILF